MRRLILVLLTLTLAAAGCGDDASTSAGDAPSADLPADPDPAEEPGGSTAPNPEPPVDDLPLGDGPYPIADLTFTILPDGPGASITYRLACLGDTATFTGESGVLDAAAACLALDDEPARGRLVLGPPADEICTEIYGGPQVARVSGTLDGETVEATIDRANGCGINYYDVVLAAVLRSAES